MGIRQALQENKTIGVVAGVLLLVIAAGFIAYRAGGMRGPRVVVPQYYFTDDDGKTTFAASADLLTPFDHNGKQAVRAHLFQCGGTKFLGYLEKYTDETRDLLMKADQAAKNAKPGDEAPPVIAQATGAARAGRVVKRPGDAKWVPFYSIEGSKITDVKCPPGSTGEPEPVVP